MRICRCYYDYLLCMLILKSGPPMEKMWEAVFILSQRPSYKSAGYIGKCILFSFSILCEYHQFEMLIKEAFSFYLSILQNRPKRRSTPLFIDYAFRPDKGPEAPYVDEPCGGSLRFSGYWILNDLNHVMYIVTRIYRKRKGI